MVAGQLIAELDTASLQARCDEARAALRAAEADRTRVRRGAEPEQIAQAQARIRNAQAEQAGAADAARNAAFLYSNPTALKAQVDAAEASLQQALAAQDAATARLRDLEAGSRDEEIGAAAADLRNATAVREQAERDAKRADDLFAADAISRQQREHAWQQVHTAQAAEDGAQARLALLRAGPRREQVAAAKAEVKQAGETVTGARRAWDDVRELYQNRTERKAAVDEAAARLKRAAAATAEAKAYLNELKSHPLPYEVRQSDAAVERAAAAVAAADEDLLHARMLAPIGGVVLDKPAQEGEVVSPGQSIVVLAAVATGELVLHLEEAHAAGVRVGQTAKIVADAFPDQDLNGHVVYIATGADPTQGTIEVRLRPDDPDRLLKPGMTADAAIVIARQEDALLIPAAAVFSVAGANYVYTVADDRLVRVRVRVRKRGSGRVAVTGLRPGAVVVTGGAVGLRTGQRVQVRRIRRGEP